MLKFFLNLTKLNLFTKKLLQTKGLQQFFYKMRENSFT